MSSQGSRPARLTGTVTPRGDAVVDILIAGPAAQQVVPCVIDTGFTGTLALPTSLVQQLGLRRRGVSAATLADGSQVVLDRYTADVDWLGSRRRVRIYATAGRTPLVGVRLLRPHRLLIDYSASTVEIS